MPEHAQAKCVYERISLVRFIEIDLASDGRDAETIAVVCNARHDAAEKTAIVGNLSRSGRGARFGSPIRGDWAETQGIHRADWPSAHREDIADNPSHARRGALKGFDRAGVVVRLDLEGNRDSVADIDDASVFFAGANEDFGRFGGEGSEQRAAVLIGTVLAPHYRKNA